MRDKTSRLRFSKVKPGHYTAVIVHPDHTTTDSTYSIERWSFPKMVPWVVVRDLRMVSMHETLREAKQSVGFLVFKND